MNVATISVGARGAPSSRSPASSCRARRGRGLPRSREGDDERDGGQQADGPAAAGEGSAGHAARVYEQPRRPAGGRTARNRDRPGPRGRRRSRSIHPDRSRTEVVPCVRRRGAWRRPAGRCRGWFRQPRRRCRSASDQSRTLAGGWSPARPPATAGPACVVSRSRARRSARRRSPSWRRAVSRSSSWHLLKLVHRSHLPVLWMLLSDCC